MGLSDSETKTKRSIEMTVKELSRDSVVVERANCNSSNARSTSRVGQ